MQFQVPQFIETEDKIVGPLSLRQFIYIGIGAGFAAMLYFVLQFWLWAILAVIFVGVATAFAFVKIEGRPLLNVVMSAFNFYWHPQTYIWQPEHANPAASRRTATKELPAEKPHTSTLEKIAAGMALHKTLQTVQTGEKISDRQFTERKMNTRYQVLQKISGERRLAKRVDYR